jgi:hypothetical protein
MKKDLCENKACSNYGRYARYCQHLSMTVPVKSEIPKKSDKQKEADKEYKKVRAKYLKAHPFCEAKLEGCGKVATEIHHKAGKIGELFTDPKNFLSVCRSCHTIIEKSPAFSRQNGFSNSRLTNVKKAS